MEYTIEKYREKIAEIEEEAAQKKRLLVREFALGNNPYKKGDIIKDDIGSLIIEKVQVHFGFGNSLPYCSYTGVELKKDGTPRLKQDNRRISQLNIIK